MDWHNSQLPLQGLHRGRGCGDDVSSLLPALQEKLGYRLLLVYEDDSDRATSSAAAALLADNLSGLTVDLVTLSSLKGFSARVTTDDIGVPGGTAQSAPSSVARMPSQYPLILVSSECLQLSLCAAMPGLSDRVFRLDHFGLLDLHDDQNSVVLCRESTRESAIQAWVSHWSTCLAHLLNASRKSQAGPAVRRGSLTSRQLA